MLVDSAAPDLLEQFEATHSTGTNSLFEPLTPELGQGVSGVLPRLGANIAKMGELGIRFDDVEVVPARVNALNLALIEPTQHHKVAVVDLPGSEFRAVGDDVLEHRSRIPPAQLGAVHRHHAGLVVLADGFRSKSALGLVDQCNAVLLIKQFGKFIDVRENELVCVKIDSPALIVVQLGNEESDKAKIGTTDPLNLLLNGTNRYRLLGVLVDGVFQHLLRDQLIIFGADIDG